jgi:hypothetical protein
VTTRGVLQRSAGAAELAGDAAESAGVGTQPAPFVGKTTGELAMMTRNRREGGRRAPDDGESRSEEGSGAPVTTRVALEGAAGAAEPIGVAT